MKSLKVTILGKQYPLKVEDSEVDSMMKIAQYVDDRLRQYKKELSKQPETTVMVLAALSLAEEIFEERKRNREMGQQEEQVIQGVNKELEKLIDEIST
ncbi:MAG: cell division protein ZapA [Balneolaceae bacterium]|nr:cell division protein ZapA [Balneolaceae bacterium]